MDELRHNDGSSAAPWRNDYPLDPGEVRKILRADAISLPLEKVEAAGSGWDFNTFRVDDDWLFRFPRRVDCMPMWSREVQSLSTLAQDLTGPVRVPRYEYVVADSQRFPLGYGGYQFLAGVSLDRIETEKVDLSRCAASLGQFLHAVHKCAALPQPATCPDPFPAYLVDIRREAAGLAPFLPAALADACLALLDAPYPIWQGTPCFHHADLGPEHLIIDPASGDLTAVIDWGDACWGDPLLDFVGWWAWTGDGPTEVALRSYGRSLSDEEWARLRFRGACTAISEAAWSHLNSRETSLRGSLASLERMHENGQLANIFQPDTSGGPYES